MFVGRREELAIATQTIAAARGACGALLYIQGEAGSGKTRLVSELLQVIGGASLHGRGTPMMGRTLPYSMWTEMFRDLGVLAGTESADITNPTALDALRYRAFDALLKHLHQRSADSPTIIVLEDLQWSDSASIDFLLHVAQRIDALPTIIVATARPVSDHHDARLAGALRHLRSSSPTMLVNLKRLHDSDVRELIEGTSSGLSAHDVDRIVLNSCGNPLFAIELSRHRHGGLPAKLEDVITLQVDSTSRPARTVLETLAVFGRPATADELGRALTLSDSMDELRELIDARLVRKVDTDHIYVANDVLAEFVYGSLTTKTARTRHAAVAAAIDEQSSRPGELAEHWFRAGRHEEALSACVRAGLEALENLAVVEAGTLLGRAIDSWPLVPDAELAAHTTLCDLLTAAGQAAVWGGNISLARTYFDRAIRAADESRSAEIMAWIARVEDADGNGARAIELYDRAITAALQLDSHLLAARMHARKAALTMQLGHTSQALDAARLAYAYAREVGEPLAASYALSVSGFAAARAGDYHQALHDLTLAAQSAMEVGPAGVVERLRADIGRAAALDRLGHLKEAADVTRKALAEAISVGLLATYASVAAGNLADQLYLLGEWREGAQVVRAAMRYPASSKYHAYLQTIYAQYLVGTGDTDQALELIGSAKKAADLEFPDFGLPLFAVEIEAYLWTSHPARSIGAFEDGCALLSADDDLVHYDWWCALAVRIEVATGRPLRRVTSAAAPSGSRTEALAWRATAEAERTRLTARPSPRLWNESYQHWLAMGRVPQQLYCGWRLVEACLSAGQRDRAAAVAGEVLHLAEQIGSVNIARAVIAVADRGRLVIAEPLPKSGPAGIFNHLTPRELQVSELVAQGMTNDQIARHLFISPRTAGVHVANCLRKLGLNRRAQLAALHAQTRSA